MFHNLVSPLESLLLRLPLEIFLILCSYLNAIDLLRLSITCRQMFDICYTGRYERAIWRRPHELLFGTHFPKGTPHHWRDEILDFYQQSMLERGIMLLKRFYIAHPSVRTPAHLIMADVAAHDTSLIGFDLFHHINSSPIHNAVLNDWFTTEATRRGYPAVLETSDFKTRHGPKITLLSVRRVGQGLETIPPSIRPSNILFLYCPQQSSNFNLYLRVNAETMQRRVRFAKHLMRAFLALPGPDNCDHNWEVTHGPVSEPSIPNMSFNALQSAKDTVRSFCLPWLAPDTQWSINDWDSTWERFHPHIQSLVNHTDRNGKDLVKYLTSAPPARPILVFISVAANLGSSREWNVLTRALHCDSVIALAGSADVELQTERAWNVADPLSCSAEFGAWGLDFVAFIFVSELRLISSQESIPTNAAILANIGITDVQRQKHILYILNWMEVRMRIRYPPKPVGVSTIPLLR